jgi:DNA/RNA-binding domain of Phe-tRNA-synthetase-like protein
MPKAVPPPPPEPVVEQGWVAPELLREHPGLLICTTTAEVGATRSSRALKNRLRDLSDRWSGRQAILLRQRPIPWAYRVFFRHIGLDPDTTPTPVEQVALDRMRDGDFHSSNRIEDGLRIAIAEVGVAVQAFDAGALEGRLGLRLSVQGERLNGRATPLESGRIVLADERRVLGFLFGAMAADAEPTRRTERATFAAIGVKGVPDVALDEALWVAATSALA